MSNGIAVSIVPGQLRMLVARTNGSVTPLHQLECELAADAVHAGLQAPNIGEPAAIADALKKLASDAGEGPARGAVLSVLIPDAAVRMALAPLEGNEPSRTEGEAMARWALRDLLPVEPGAARIDWAVVGAESTGKWILAMGADAEVVREYEAAVAGLGCTPGRVVPLTMALAVGAGEPAAVDDPRAARLVLSGIGGQMACLVEADGVPRLHRAWRGAGPDLAVELPSIQRYVDQRLDLSIVEAVVSGPEEWRQRAAADCDALGWQTATCSSWSAHIGAVQP